MQATLKISHCVRLCLIAGLLAFLPFANTNALTPEEFDVLRTQYAELNLAENVTNYNVIEIPAEQLSAEALQAALKTAAQTLEDDLIVIRTDSNNGTLLLNGNPITIDIDPERFGSVTIVTASNTPLIVDTQELSRAFCIDSGDVAMGGMKIYGMTWDFAVDYDYDGLVTVWGDSVLTTCDVQTFATEQPEPENPIDLSSLGNDVVPCEEPGAEVGHIGIMPMNANITSFAVEEPRSRPYGATDPRVGSNGLGYSGNSAYMIGNVHVTLVLMESTGAASELDWSSEQIQKVRQEVRAGLDWWQDMFYKTCEEVKAGSGPGLKFHIDYWENKPFETSYEPIRILSQNDSRWVGEFLEKQGYPGYDRTMRGTAVFHQFNDDQRCNNKTDWAFTIFIRLVP